MNHSRDGRDNSEYVRGRDGRPLVDRYGRPVRRRGTNPPQRRPRRGEQAGARSVDSRPVQQFPQPKSAPASPPAYAPVSGAASRADLGSAVGSGAGAGAGVGSGSAVGAGAGSASWGHGRASIRRRKTGLRIRPKGCLGAIAWALAIILVGTVALGVWADAQLNRVEATAVPRNPNTAGTNWLLVGSDSRQGLSEEDVVRLGTGGDLGVGRTDTIMVLHIPNSGQARLVSIPRDSYVAIPGYGMDKINAAFTYGGPVLLTTTVEQATGLRIDHYAEIGMGGLANVVDAVGGVELCPGFPINDPLANLNIQAGCQTMDGPTSLGYVRTRATPMGDLDRVDRQREFFAALVNQATSPATLLNPFRAFPLVSGTAQSFTVGDNDHVWHLARVAMAMSSGVVTETVPVGGFADTAVGNVVLWDEAGAEELWAGMR